MAVIIRETREIAGKRSEVKIYRTDGLLTREEKQRAEELDDLIQREMSAIVEDLKEKSLITGEGEKKNLEIWYKIGGGLQFIDQTDLIEDRDRKYIWRAIYDHSGPLHTGDIPVRADRPKNNDFRYAYLLAKNFDWEFVESGGTWTTWGEFFDSPVIRNDQRIIDWLGTVKERRGDQGLQDWIRPLTVEIRRELKNVDTGVFEKARLVERLERIYNSIKG
ncbi:MAG: hypothetical protein MAG715_00997 [Methanonatronarchaeales archaeon]|nr:hypothetical protein [Methanonatronarchaeales archaeon]